MTEYRITWGYDHDADWSWLDQDEFEGESADDYVALWAQCETNDENKGWEVGDSLGGITFMASAWLEVGTFDTDHEYHEAYQGGVAAELLDVTVGNRGEERERMAERALSASLVAEMVTA